MRLSTLTVAATLLITVGCNGDSIGVTSSSEGNGDQVLAGSETPETPDSSVQLTYRDATFVATGGAMSSVVKFTDDEVFWTQSGTTDSGTYSNNGEASLVAAFASADISFSAAGGDIIWNSVEHKRAAGSQFDSQESLDTLLDGAKYISVELLPGGEGENGVQVPANWSMRFEDGNSQWATRDTTAVGAPTYVDGSSFDVVSYDGRAMPVVMLHNDQMVISGDIYAKDFSTQFDSQEALTEFLEGTSYESVTLRQMGPVVDGVATAGRWRIDFTGDTFQWSYEDVTEAGTISYIDNNSFTAVFNGREIVIDVDSGIVWDGVRYSKVAN